MWWGRTPKETKRIALAVITGHVGVIAAILLFGTGDKLRGLITATVIAAVGYFWLGKKFFNGK